MLGHHPFRPCLCRTSVFVIELTLMTSFLRDLRFGARAYLRRPIFTLIVVATLALGVGAHAAIFSVVSGILLRPLPYPHAEQLFSFGHEAPEWLTSEPDFLDYRRAMTSLDGLSAYTRSEATLSNGDNPQRVRLVSLNTIHGCFGRPSKTLLVFDSPSGGSSTANCTR